MWPVDNWAFFKYSIFWGEFELGDLIHVVAMSFASLLGDAERVSPELELRFFYAVFNVICDLTEKIIEISNFQK